MMNKPRTEPKQIAAPTGAERFQRVLLAFIAACLLIAGALMQILGDASNGGVHYLSGTLLKTGIVVGIAWLAAPQLQRMGWERIQGTTLIAVGIVIILFMIRARLGAIAASLLLAGSLLLGALGWIRSQLTRR